MNANFTFRLLSWLFLVCYFIPNAKSSVTEFYQNKGDTVICSVIRKNIMFFSDGQFHPFSIQLKNYGYFEPLYFYLDIKYGFYEPVDSLWKRVYYDPCLAESNQVLISSGKDIYIDIDKTDTLISYFSGNRKVERKEGDYKLLTDTVKLSRELEYSYLLREIGKEPLWMREDGEELRVVFVHKHHSFVRKKRLMHVIFTPETAKLHFTEIDTESSQHIHIVRNEFSNLRTPDREELESRIKNTDFYAVQSLNYDYNDLYFDGYRPYEFLIEYKKEDAYYYAIMFDMDIREPKDDPRRNAAIVKNLTRSYYIDYFLPNLRTIIRNWFKGRRE